VFRKDIAKASAVIGVTGVWWSVPIGWFLADVTGVGYYFIQLVLSTVFEIKYITYIVFCPEIQSETTNFSCWLYRAVAKPGMSVVLTVISLGTRVVLAYLLSAVIGGYRRLVVGADRLVPRGCHRRGVLLHS